MADYTLRILTPEQADARYLSVSGTTPGSVPVVKPTGDGRSGVWEFTHNDTTGYLFHLLAGSGMGHNAALLGLGVDNDGIGIVIPNKKLGRGIVGDQRATVTAEDGYWLHATQRSAAAPLVRLEMQANDGADVLQLIAFGTPGAAQRLLYVSDISGEAGRIRADDGRLLWQRTIRTTNQSNGETPSYFEATTSAAANGSNTRKAYHGASHDIFFGATGTSGSYYPYRFAHDGSVFAIQTASTVTGKGTNPLPTDVTTWTTQLSVTHSSGVSISSGVIRANTNVLGFYGATAVARPAAVVDATDAATAVTQLNALLARLRTIGLIST